jgi:exodeoxyribonuclease V gamma subunit
VALHLYRSNRLEFLATVLGELLRSSPPEDPFTPVRVVVGSRGMARWLRHRLAEQLSICANVVFPFPAATLDAVVRAVQPNTIRQDPWAPDALVWTVLSSLRELSGEPEFEWFTPYIAKDGIVTPRQWGIARQVAEVFDRYITYRPAQAVAWSAGAPVDPVDDDLRWQPILWKHLAKVTGVGHRASRSVGATHAMYGGEAPEGWSSIRIFGVSSLPPAWLDLIGAIAKHVQVDIFLLCPSSEYWADLRKRFTADVQWRTLDKEDVSTHLALPAGSGNPLLASLGRQAREFQLVLESQPEDYEDERLDLFRDPTDDGATALHALQSDVLHAQPPTPTALASGDSSIQLHACHGSTRQVEVLRDVLLELFDSTPGLHPRDVLVMTPDIATYAPLVSSVFSQGRPYKGSDKWGPSGTPNIPFEIADLSAKDNNPVAEALLRVLDLATGRIRASEVLDFLGLAPVRQRFGIARDDLPRIADWVQDSGIRWGLDAAHRATHGQPEDAQNTWSFGIDRLLLGACMQETGGDLFGGIYVFDAIEGADTLVLGRLIHALRTLFAELADLRQPRLPSEWTARIAQTLTALTEVREDEAWLAVAVNEALDTLHAEASVSPDPRPATVQVMHTVLTERFARVSGHAKEQSGAVTFCAMAPMRSVPYRVICLLGLDDGALPRVAKPTAFDMTARHPRPGDRDLRDEDRYLFLEAILAARDVLVVTWTGKDVRSNEERPPATPLSELMTVIDHTLTTVDGTPASAQLTTIHALQAHSRANFERHGPPTSYDRSLLAGAVTASSPSTNPPPFFTQAHASQTSESSLALDDLIVFLESPSEFLLRRRLSVDLRDSTDSASDREPIALGGLERWAIWHQIIQSRLSGTATDALHAHLAAQGAVPLGYAGVRVTQDWATIVDDALDAVALVQSDGTVRPANPVLPIAVNVGNVTVNGSISRAWQDQLIHIQFGSERGKRWIRPWVELVAWAAATGSTPHALVVWRDNKKGPQVMGLEPPQAPYEVLADLVALYERGCRGPLPLFADTSFAFAKSLGVSATDWDDALQNHDSVAKALSSAQGKWLGYYGGDGTDPHVQKLFDGRFPALDPDSGAVDPAFVEAARRLFAPLVQARTTASKAREWVRS